MDRDNMNYTILDRSGPRIKKTTASPTTQGGVEKCATGGVGRREEEKELNIKVTKQEITIGTWNVRTLNVLGKPEQLDHEMRRYRWAVLGLAELRWTGIGEITTNDGHTLWYSGEEKSHEKGVGFLVHKDVAKSVMECRPISNRIITMRLAGQPLNISIVQVYAPTSTASVDEIEQFYQQKIITEEQAGFRTGRSTVEQIFNLWMLSEKFRTNQKPLFHSFIDFKKAFDRVSWQEGMCDIMRLFNMSKGIVNAIEALYESSKSEVLLEDEISDWFCTHVGVRQGCLLSPTIFNIYLEYHDRGTRWIWRVGQHWWKNCHQP